MGRRNQRAQQTESDLVTDPEQGLFRGRTVARRFESADGFTILVGRTASENDIVTFKLSSPRDFWFHVAAQSGSHVLVRNPDGVERLPRATERYAAGLAAGHSGARGGGRVAVHMASMRDVSKRRGAPVGQVEIKRYSTVHAEPTRD